MSKIIHYKNNVCSINFGMQPFQKDTNNKFSNFEHIDDDNYDDEDDEHDNEPLHDHLQNNDDKTDVSSCSGDFLTKAHSIQKNNVSNILIKRVNFKIRSNCNSNRSIKAKNELILINNVKRKRRKKHSRYNQMNNDLTLEHSRIKNVVFNGTFPIDYPYCSRFIDRTVKYNSNSNSSSASSYTNSSEKKINNNNLNLNYANYKMELNKSSIAFTNHMSFRKRNNAITSFNIDEPI